MGQFNVENGSEHNVNYSIADCDLNCQTPGLFSTEAVGKSYTVSTRTNYFESFFYPFCFWVLASSTKWTVQVIQTAAW